MQLHVHLENTFYFPEPRPCCGTRAIALRPSGEGRRALLPAPEIPLLYFGFAHICLALALAVLAVRPDLPGGFFHHPRMIAVVHLVTLGWISGSILGAFYIVGPLALRLPLRPGKRDRVAFGAFRPK
jgi:hypothetical protein